MAPNSFWVRILPVIQTAAVAVVYRRQCNILSKNIKRYAHSGEDSHQREAWKDAASDTTSHTDIN